MFYPVAIVGAGPAGITAAIQLQRSGIKPLLFEKDKVGGLVLNANLIENYPGFYRGISGAKLIKHFTKHLTKLDIKVLKRNVNRIEIMNDGFKILTNKEIFQSRTIIAASGTKPWATVINREKEFLPNSRVFYEIKDLPRYNKNTVFTIIGGGDAAFDYALNLASKARSVNIIFRSKKPKSLNLLVKRVKAKDNIKLFADTIPISLTISKTSSALTVRMINKLTIIHSDYILIATGREPCIDYLPARPRLGGPVGKTSGLFLAGDVRHGDFRQIGIAVGDGLLVAMQVIKYLTRRQANLNKK